MDDRTSNNQMLIMAFGLPIVTTLIVTGSMYVGHLITTTSERPTEVRVQTAQPRIDVNVPQCAPPHIHVAATAPQVDVHVPTAPPAPPPAITVNTPQAPAPQITVNAPPTMVTIIDKRETEKPKSELAAAPAPPISPTVVVAPAGSATQAATVAPAPPAPPASVMRTSSEIAAAQRPAATPAALASTPNTDPLGGEPTLDNLYAHATRYIDLYCRKHGLDPTNESRRWNNVWRANLDQALNDNIDSSEQSYINRIVIAKRDYFNMSSTTPDKVVEACRILLRYRDGQLAWLQAMRDALTNENLRKTMAFLAQGP